MKRILLIAFMLATAFTSCSGDEDSQVTEKTSLELTLKDEDGNIITTGMGIARLYPTENDWSYDTNQIGEPGFADANGKITFTNLTAQKYYWRVENGCRNNFTTSITMPQPLVANIANKADVPLTTFFNLQLIKSTAYQDATFMVYINNTTVLTIPAGPDVHTVPLIPPHSVVRVVQTNNTPNPIDVTYSDLDGDCGETVTLNYPN